MKKHPNPDNPTEMDEWMRNHFRIRDHVSTEEFLAGWGYFADSPAGVAKRLEVSLAWIEPVSTDLMKPILHEIRAILSTYNQRQHTRTGQQPDWQPRWQPGDPLVMPLPRPPVQVQHGLNEMEARQLEQGRLLFEQAMVLHRQQPAVIALEKQRAAQSERASKPRKLTEEQAQRIANLYWEAKRQGGRRGIVKELASTFDVTPTTIQNVAKKYQPKENS